MMRSGNTSFFENRTALTVCFILFFAFVFFFNLGGRTIENKDYPHFAEIGREILETGDWVIMHSNGKIYVDKPPLHTAFIALALKAFGVTPFGGRFPAALFGLLGVLAVFYFGRRTDTKEPLTAGLHAALLLLASYGYFILTRRFRNDIEYAVLFSLTLFLFYEGFAAPEKRRKVLCYGLSWLCTGLAALVKGPAAFLPLLIIVIFLLVRRGWRQLGAGVFLGTSLVCVAVVLPYLALLVTHRDFKEFYYLLTHTTIMRRHAGLFYYIPVFIAKFFPGSVLIILAAPLLWKKRLEIKADPWKLFLLIWAGVYLVLVHCITAKVYRYLLPAFPPLAILTAWGARLLLTGKQLPGRALRFWKIPAALVCLGFPAVIWVRFGFSPAALAPACVGFGLLALAGGRMKDALAFVCILCVTAYLFIDLLDTGRNKKVSDIARMYRALAEKKVGPEEVLIYNTTGRVGALLAFYYNRVLQPEVEKDLRSQPGIKAVITDTENIPDVVAAFGPAAETRELKNHSGKKGGSQHTVLFFHEKMPP